MTAIHAYPSPFYALFESARTFELRFPCDEDGYGPLLLETGEIDAGRCLEYSEEPIGAVLLEEGCYRLAERCAGPFSGLAFNRGDEFIAKAIDDDVLIFERLVLPRKFVHCRMIGSSGFSNQNPFAELLHRHGGGWESIAGGILTFTIPVATVEQFSAEATRLDIMPQGLLLQ